MSNLLFYRLNSVGSACALCYQVLELTPKGTICLYWIMVLHVMSYSAGKGAYLLKGAIVYQVLVVGIYLSNSDYLCHQVLGILIGAKSVRFISQ